MPQQRAVTAEQLARALYDVDDGREEHRCAALCVFYVFPLAVAQIDRQRRCERCVVRGTMPPWLLAKGEKGGTARCFCCVRISFVR